MAATATRSPRSMPQSGKKVDVISVAWTSDAGGAASVVISQIYGFLLKIVTDPTDGPTDNYDITLIDENGVDALANAGVDRDTTNSEQVYPMVSGAAIPIFLCGDHTFTIANAGAIKSGVTVFYVTESL